MTENIKIFSTCRCPTRWTETQVRAVWNRCRRRIWTKQRRKKATTTTWRQGPRSASDLISFVSYGSNILLINNPTIWWSAPCPEKAWSPSPAFHIAWGLVRGHLQPRPKSPLVLNQALLRPNNFVMSWPLQSHAPATLTLIVLMHSSRAAALDCPQRFQPWQYPSLA